MWTSASPSRAQSHCFSQGSEGGPKGCACTFFLLAGVGGSGEKRLPHLHPWLQSRPDSLSGPVGLGGGGAPTLSVPASWPWLGRLYEQPALPLPRSLLWSQRQGFIAPRGQRLCGSPSALAALFLGLGRPSALQKASPSVVFLVLAEGSSGACGGRAPGVPETFPAFGAESPWDWSTRVKFWAEASGFNSIISCR